MPRSNWDSFQQNYVYTTDDSNDYKKIFVDLRLVDETPTFKIFTDEYITKPILEDILKNFQSNQFYKMKINIPKECVVMMSVNDDLYDIVFSDNGCEIKDIVPQNPYQ